MIWAWLSAVLSMMSRLRTAVLSIATLLAAAVPAMASSPEEEFPVDEAVSDYFTDATAWYVDIIFSPFPGTDFPWIVLWLVGAATVFTLYFGFIQFRGFAHAVALTRGDYANRRDAGEVSHFQALTTAVSGTVGLGNIAGVGVAVTIGGPGATFWMVLAGLLSMASKFTECTLAVKFRNEYEDGTVSGGPMYYLTKGFAARGLRGGKLMAILFAVFCILGSIGGGNMFQANQTHAQLETVVGAYPGWITGLALAAIVFLIIIGGVKAIARVTVTVVPFVAGLYIIAALIIIAVHYDRIGWAFGQIFAGAFTDVGVAGGMVGALIQGLRRAALSNEAGIGSSAIAHSAVRTKEPVTEGYVAMLEPFIDTVVICTATALVIITSGQLVQDPSSGLYLWDASASRLQTVDGNDGVALTSAAFSTVFWWFDYTLSVAVLLFAFSTMISWSYYGLKAWTYLVGEGRGRELAFKIAFCLFVVVGASTGLTPVINFTDAAVFSLGIVNVIGLYLLMPFVRRELLSYRARLKSGEIKKRRRRAEA